MISELNTYHPVIIDSKALPLAEIPEITELKKLQFAAIEFGYVG
jgi:hypothetical protein